jgi:hypothetical protein
MSTRRIVVAVLSASCFALAVLGYLCIQRNKPIEPIAIAVSPQPSFIKATAKPDITNPYKWLPLATIGSNLSSDYSISQTDGTVQFKSGQGEITISSADPSSFEVAVLQSGASTTPLDYAKDQNHIYDLATEIVGADVGSFTLLPYQNASVSPGYAKDKNYAYVMDYLLPLASTSVKAQQISIDDADVATFEALYVVSDEGGASESYAKDKSHVYERSEIMPGADPNSITLVGNAVLKDSNSVYGDLTGIDAPSFVALGGGFFRDKNRFYCGTWQVLSVESTTTFQVQSDGYASDAVQRYSVETCSPAAK